MKTKYICGIDYSLTSPSLCFFNSEEPIHPKNCDIYYLSSSGKYLVDFSEYRFYGSNYGEWYSDQERYDIISQWAMHRIRQYEPVQVYIEGYSFGSVGRVFQIAENTAILKQDLWNQGYVFEALPPTTVKKHATGKGNADKEKMNAQYLTDGGFDIKKVFKMTDKQWNPSSDMIDSYYIAKTGFEINKLKNT